MSGRGTVTADLPSFLRQLHEDAWGTVPELVEAADEIERLRDAIDGLFMDREARYVVLCDDGSIIATADLMEGDDVLVDRGADR